MYLSSGLRPGVFPICPNGALQTLFLHLSFVNFRPDKAKYLLPATIQIEEPMC